MPRKFERYAVLLLLVASPFWLPAVSLPVSGSLRMQLAGWLEPCFHGIQNLKVGLRTLVFGVLQGPFLLEENQVLRRYLDSTLAHEETHRQLFLENERLRALLDFKEKAPWKTIPAAVLAKEQTLWFRTLLLDKGTRDGVAAGMAVITPTGLIGRVQEVGPSASRVIGLADPHFRCSAVTSLHRAWGLFAGTSSGELLLTYLSKEATLKPGEVVLTSGGRSFSPPGIPIGTVLTVSEDPSGLFQSARVRSTVDLGSVEEVLVVPWSGE